MEKLIQGLLDDTKNIIERTRKKKQKDGECFNLLEVAGISTLEVKMCRILAGIIDPKGKHYQGELFLRSFAKKVLKTQLSEEEMKKATVFTEYPTDKNRRIDIAIKTPSRFIPIEVKIYAGDQERQCVDYYNFANNKSKKESKVFYLTIDGHLPQENTGLSPINEGGEIVGYKEITAISFKYDVCSWLEEIIVGVSDKPLLYASLMQFKNALEKLGGNMDKEMRNEITGQISLNSDSMRAAIAIAESVNVAKEKLMLKIFKRFTAEMKKLPYPIEYIEYKYNYEYNDNFAIHNFYRKKTYPSVAYRYKKIDESKEIWFVIEIGSQGFVYCGFVLAENKENPGRLVLSDDKIRSFFKNPEFEMDKETWWFYWRYLPIHIGTYYHEECPDFKECNQAYIDLYENEKFEKFIKISIMEIKKILDEMI